MSDGIVFQVETTRVLQILTREIYDSSLALIRENLQNAYDAVRMRFASSGTLADGGRIDINVGRTGGANGNVGAREAVVYNADMKKEGPCCINSRASNS